MTDRRYNMSELPELEARINNAYEHRNDSEEATEHFNAVIQDITGPNGGLEWDDKTYKLGVSDLWAPNENGDILEISKHTGPAGEYNLVDGVLVRR